ncbi:MAG: 50S ribosomal protein L15 [Simkaniaceae bacterium]|nr:50S ribosomal protein L15 [Simkaniaceae bacterium]
MTILSTLENSSRGNDRRKRKGRGVGSKRGKTCCRGHKGDKSRSGYKRRYGNEGGQGPLYQKKPTRGFANGRFRKEVFAINLDRIEMLFEDGEILSVETLKEKGHLAKDSKATLKILSQGELKKKVTIHAHGFSKVAMEKLEKHSIEFKTV